MVYDRLIRCTNYQNAQVERYVRIILVGCFFNREETALCWNITLIPATSYRWLFDVDG